KGELDACVNETVRLAEEVEIGALELLDLSVDAGATGLHALTYVMALSAAQGLEGKDQATAHYNADIAANSLGKVKPSEKHYKLAIEADTEFTTVPSDLNKRITYITYKKNGTFTLLIRNLVGFFGRIIFWIGITFILLNAFYFTYLSGNYFLLFFEIIFYPLTYLIYPLYSGLWWLLIISLLGYWASTFIGNMEPVE
ncbi:MAG: hypothetical protein KAT05_03820, partial [Spirochaetes bacterium]|nr:hypothetical protein [Spirochaetota bacterium]